MEEFSFFIEHEKKNIVIDGKIYPFTIFLSTEDGFTIINIVSNKSISCRRAVAEYIQTRIDIPEDQKPSADCIMAEDDDFFKGIFELLFQNDNFLKEIYEANIDDSDICHRFVSAIKTEMDDIRHMQLSPISIPQMQLPQMSFETCEAIRMAQKWCTHYIRAIHALTSNCEHITNTINQISNLWDNNITKFIEGLEAVWNKLLESLRSVSIPELSDERKEQLCASYNKWGECGWTLPLSAPVNFFNTPPLDQKDASAKALKYCRDNDMESLFAALRKIPYVKTTDIEEAIFSFRNKRYKSCVMILFSLIDARLIRLQRDEDRDHKKRRKSGYHAAKILFDHIADEQDIRKKIHMFLLHQNIISCLQTVFENGNDFCVQPVVINRHFIDHGMLIRRVIRKDCVQVFLLYYHLMHFLDSIYGKH